MHKLYILMRSDMESLSTGKIAAQASHATSLFHENVREETEFNEWAECDGSFGTCIVLDGKDEKTISEIVYEAESYGLSAEFVVDPTYPVKDGSTTHLVSVMTCAYVFVTDNELHYWKKMQKLKLYR